MICESLRFWLFLRPRCFWCFQGKGVDLRLRRISFEIRGREVLGYLGLTLQGVRRRRAETWDPEAIISLSTRAVVAVQAMNRAMGACARMASVARRSWRAETFVATPDKCVHSKRV